MKLATLKLSPEERLEARVAQLEKLVQELLDWRAAKEEQEQTNAWEESERQERNP